MSQKEELERVNRKIAGSIKAFKQQHAGKRFYAEELRRHVRHDFPEIAPDSPGRILRQLRLDGILDYVVIDRSNSLYQFR